MTRALTIPPALRALIDAGLSLANRSSSARYALARAGGFVEGAMLPGLLRPPIMGLIEEAVAAMSEPLEPKAVRKLAGKEIEEIEEEPLAIGPGAQVHRGVADGRAVAVKVRHPKLAATMRSDLVLVDALTRPLKGVFGALDPGPFLAEVRERVLDELDLEHQADHQRQVARGLRDVDGVVVPAPLGELCRHEVLVTELLEGPTLAQTGHVNDAAALARALAEAHRYAARELGILLADPRPDHVVLLADGRVGLLGTGATRTVDRDRVAAALDALVALRAGDEDAFAATVARRLELLPEDAARAALPILREIAGELLTGPARLDAAALADAGDRALAALPELLALAAQVTPQPSDLWALRMLGQLGATLAVLEVTEDWPELALQPDG